jgi:tRNA-dihydrouridine synthase B
MRIGKLELNGNIVLAPMAGVTDPPFRRMVQDFGVSAVWTEMISAHSLAVKGNALRVADLKGHQGPTVFQIWGSDPLIMAQAARAAQLIGAAAVDLNMGCPVKKVTQTGAGAALMKNPLLAARIVACVREATDIPVTVKLRSGWDNLSRNAPELAKIAEQEGADAVVIHARSCAEKHSGAPSLDVIADVKSSVGFPVIGNGGVKSELDVEQMIGAARCDGVMIGRAALGRPWLPARILGAWTAEQGSNLLMMDVVRRHCRYTMQWSVDADSALRLRRHLGWYARGFNAAAVFRESLERLRDWERLMDAAQRFFGEKVIP